MNGGKRPGAGRPKGSLNKRTIEMRAMAERTMRAALSDDLTPVDVMLAVMRGDASIGREQFEAAVAVAPYVCPRLSAIAVQPIDPVAAMTPEQRCRRIEELLAVREALTIEGTVEQSSAFGVDSRGSQ